MSVLNLVQSRARGLGRSVHDRLYGRGTADTGLFDPSEGEILMRAREGTGSWVGAPSVFVDGEDIYLTLRWRDERRRGHRSGVFRLVDDGLEELVSMDKQAFDACSLEGAALGREDGRYVLYQSYQPSPTSWWRVDKMTASTPAGFDPGTRERVLEGYDGHLKDPVLYDGRLYVDAPSRLFRSSSTLVVEDDAVSGTVEYERDGGPSRLTSMIDIEGVTVAMYDWRPSWFHVGAERSRYGLFGEGVVVPLVEDASIRSEAGDGSVRYVAGACLDDEVVYVYERASEDGSHDIVISRVPCQAIENRLIHLR